MTQPEPYATRREVDQLRAGLNLAGTWTGITSKDM